MNLEELEEKVMDRANFYMITRTGDLKQKNPPTLRTCIEEATLEITHLTESQFCSIYGVFLKDTGFTFNKFVDKLYNKMIQNGAKDNGCL